MGAHQNRGKLTIQLTFYSALLMFLWSVGLPAAYAGNCTINTIPYWDGSVTLGWLAAAQTFAAPSPSCNVLSNYEFALAGRTMPGDVQFSIYRWASGGPSGSALFTTTLLWGTSPGLFDISGINLTLIPGQLYGADVNLLGYSGRSLYFDGNQMGDPGGTAWWYNPANGGWNIEPGLNDYFKADFRQPTPESPTLALLLLGLALASLKFMRSRALND